MKLTSPLQALLCVATSLSLAACGGGEASLSGTMTGLGTGASVVLQDNDSNDLTLSANGPFMFATDLQANSPYDVTVLTQPAGETCSVSGGTGTVDTNDDSVSSVAVTCTTTASVGGTVSGLGAGTSVTLSNEGTALPIAVNGAFAFPGVLAAGTAYDVVVTTQPVGMTCTVTNPSGVVVDGTMANVSVVCS